MKAIYILAFTLVLQLLSFKAFAISTKCEFVLDNITTPNPFNPLLDLQAVRFTEDPIYKKAMTKKSKAFAEALTKLLSLSANTVNENANEKLSLEKGEIYLGHKMQNGASFEFRYVIDQRAESPRFILEKIKYYKSNMQETEISDNPIDEDLQNLNITSVILAKKKIEKDSRYSIIEKDDINDLLDQNAGKIESSLLSSQGDYLSELDLKNIMDFARAKQNSTLTDILNIKNEKIQNATHHKTIVDETLWSLSEIKIPFIISGELLDVFIEKSDLYQDLDRHILRNSLKEGSLGKLNMLGYRSFLAHKVKKVFIKQSVKGLIWQVPLFAFIYILNQMHNIEKDIASLDDTEPVLVSQEISNMLNEIFDRVDSKQDWHNAKLYKQMKDEIKVNLSQSVSSLIESSERLVNWYILKESDKLQIGYLRSNEDLTQFTKVNPGDFLNKQNTEATMEHLIFQFPQQKTLILITRSYSRIDPKQMTFESHVVINAKKTPLLYNGLINLINKKK